jgi:hypothetical protein
MTAQPLDTYRLTRLHFPIVKKLTVARNLPRNNPQRHHHFNCSRIDQVAQAGIPQSAQHAGTIKQIAYCSVAKALPIEQNWQQLIAQFQRNNQKQGITGLMMVDANLIIQWIEGEPAAVDALWARIEHDARHHCIVPLVERVAQERLFADWGLRKASRNEMLAIVREARKLAQDQSAADQPWEHALATLSILIDPDLSAFYAKTKAISKGGAHA